MIFLIFSLDEKNFGKLRIAGRNSPRRHCVLKSRTEGVRMLLVWQCYANTAGTHHMHFGHRTLRKRCVLKSRKKVRKHVAHQGSPKEISSVSGLYNRSGFDFTMGCHTGQLVCIGGWQRWWVPRCHAKKIKACRRCHQHFPQRVEQWPRLGHAFPVRWTLNRCLEKSGACKITSPVLSIGMTRGRATFP